MRDNDIRCILLQKFYDLRKDNRQHQLYEVDLGPIDIEDYNRIGKQLGEMHLVDWYTPLARSGCGRITSYGADVIEGNTAVPMPININDHRISAQGPQNVQIGNSNTISANVDVRSVLSAIDKANATDAEKEEARDLFMHLFNSPTFASIAGAIMGMGSGSARG
jgi:hypothetical protein